MRKTILAAAAIAALLSIEAPAQRAAAMTLAAPTELGIAPGDAGLVQKAAVRCGYRACVRVWRRPHWGWHRHYWGWPIAAVVARPWVHVWVRPWAWHWPRHWGWGWGHHHAWGHWRHW